MAARMLRQEHIQTFFKKPDPAKRTCEVDAQRNEGKEEAHFVAYEREVMLHHADTTGHAVWQWGRVPEWVLLESGYIAGDVLRDHRMARKEARDGGMRRRKEYGLDGMAHDEKEGVFHGIQAKNYGPKTTIVAEKLGTFLSVVMNRLVLRLAKAKGYLYYTGRLERQLAADLGRNNSLVAIPYAGRRGAEKQDQRVHAGKEIEYPVTRF
mgnify:CR=1 FL=1